MARLDRGLSAFVALTASLLLLLLSPKIFANDDAVFNNHLASGDSAAVAAALVDSEVKVSKTKIALPFGNKAAAHLNHLADKSLWAFPRIKRADPSDGEDEEPITITW